ncbi:MAG: ABC transporter permease subunit [Aliifodinibius sp.]|nr:carbohydrate ABC transporter permease [Fodinibius sp.]NIW44903.1 ABC transporter permease subunit [Gammaproteobacteria bacterium]NIW97956.1 ABC transporter permease subunit [Phycisphaerae bacterium]NIY25621.1 ABC transporter permease subunit [Fodinibius sp.]
MLTPKTQKKLLSVVFHLAMIVVSLITILPFLWMLSTSFMETGEAAVFPPKFMPDAPTLDQYTFLFDRMNLGRYFLNSLIIAVSVTLISLLVNSMAGFAFAKYSFRAKKPIFALLLSSMIIPTQVTMLPVFLLLNKLGLLNTYFGIILPAMASIFGIFLFHQYLKSVPDDLIEAARIDGASDFLIYWKIILPLAMPVLVTLALFTFMGTWNEFLWPLIVLTKSDMYTLPVALANLLGEHVQDPELMMAGSVITIIPVLLVFLALQRYYLAGILIGGLKE